jgi:xanthine dehydrogenase accessory factor
LITDYVTGLQSRAEALRSGRQPYVMATVVRALRPTSAKAGDRALVLPDGTIEGFVGGTCAESSVRLHSLRVLKTGEAVMLRIIPEEGEDVIAEGLVTVANPCASGGMLEIFLEGVFPPPLIQIAGDGPTARALREVGAALGYDVRAAAPGDPALPDAAAVIVAGHGRGEEPVLRAALAAGVPYLGLVASKKRGAQVLTELDLSREEASRVHTPAGLDIGARTVQEIALSIYAEMVAERPRRGRSGLPAAAGSAGLASSAGSGPRDPGPPDPGPLDPGLAGPGRPASDPASSAEVGGTSGDSGPETATDPVCGMTVAVSEASLQLTHDERMWYFCGPGCQQAFADDPGRYQA